MRLPTAGERVDELEDFALWLDATRTDTADGEDYVMDFVASLACKFSAGQLPTKRQLLRGWEIYLLTTMDVHA